MLTEDQYFELQRLSEFGLKISSWLQAPAELRKLDGAIFCARRYGRVFIYHDGAQSCDAVRGGRGALRV